MLHIQARSEIPLHCYSRNTFTVLLLWLFGIYTAYMNENLKKQCSYQLFSCWRIFFLHLDRILKGENQKWTQYSLCGLPCGEWSGIITSFDLLAILVPVQTRVLLVLVAGSCSATARQGVCKGPPEVFHYSWSKGSQPLACCTAVSIPGAGFYTQLC